MNNGPKVERIESICAVLREQGVQEDVRTYRAWKTRLPALQAIEDAKFIDTFCGLNKRDAKGRPRPEILCGRRKMTAWLRRNGFPEVSKYTVDRLMRDEGIQWPDPGPQDPHHHPWQGRQTCRRPVESKLQRQRPQPHMGLSDFTYVPVYSGFVYVALVIDLYSRAIVGWETSTVKDTAFVEPCSENCAVAPATQQ